jgi:hypothetical protein
VQDKQLNTDSENWVKSITNTRTMVDTKGLIKHPAFQTPAGRPIFSEYFVRTHYKDWPHIKMSAGKIIFCIESLQAYFADIEQKGA